MKATATELEAWIDDFRISALSSLQDLHRPQDEKLIVVPSVPWPPPTLLNGCT